MNLDSDHICTTVIRGLGLIINNQEESISPYLRLERGWEARSRWKKAFIRVQAKRNLRKKYLRMNPRFSWKVLCLEFLLVLAVLAFLPLLSLVLFVWGNTVYVKMLLYQYFKD